MAYWLTCLLLCLSCGQAWAKSIQCSQAKKSIELLICADERARELDKQLDDTLGDLLVDASTVQRRKLNLDQQQWIEKDRDLCSDAKCLSRAYEARLKQINPLSDNEISCDKMEKYPHLVFGHGGPDLGSGSYSPTGADYSCPQSLSSQKFLQPLLNMAELIHGDSGPQQCGGTIVHALWRYYQFGLAKAGVAPVLFAKDEKAAAADSPRPTLDYFEQWGESSRHNYRIVQKYMREQRQARPQLLAFYRRQRHLSVSEANAAADQVEHYILDRAAGSFPLHEFQASSPLVLTVRDEHASIMQLRSLLQDKTRSFTDMDVYRAIEASLLHRRPTSWVQVLLDHLSESDWITLGKEREPLLAFAVPNQQYVELLLSRGVPVDAQNGFGKTALFYAIEENQLDIVRTLLVRGANVNHAYLSADELRRSDDYVDVCIFPNLTHTRRTPLMHAAQHADTAMLQVLLAAGARTEDLDDQGDNALNYAINNRQEHNQLLLKATGLRIR